MGDVVAEGLGVERIAQREEGRELGKSAVVEPVEVRQVAALVNLVDIRLLGREGDIGLDLLADRSEERIVYEVRDDAVLVGSR